ncbi:MAG: hypothetical protein RDU76_11525 [Candidatus Edwardsbacteria bacterium]|nr:hypothetical protein [Candidatus Edwardsbacteria bacterium]
MAESSFLLKLILNLGINALIFLIWFFYHRGQISLFTQMINGMQAREQETMKVLKDQTETLQYLSGILGRMEQKIDSNQYCPMIKKEGGR